MQSSAVNTKQSCGQTGRFVCRNYAGMAALDHPDREATRSTPRARNKQIRTFNDAIEDKDMRI
jgi:hypothetical protein